MPPHPFPASQTPPPPLKYLQLLPGEILPVHHPAQVGHKFGTGHGTAEALWEQGGCMGAPSTPPSIILHPPPKHPKNAGCGFLGSSPFPYLPVEVGVQQHDGTRQGVHGIWRGARGGVRVGVSSPPQVRTPVTVNPSGCSWGCPKALGGDGWGN